MKCNVFYRVLLLEALYISISLQAFCQNVVVINVAQNIKDASASTNLRKDSEGTACALVKVLCVNKNVQFSGDVVGAIANKTNEYWVYMKKDSEFLTVSAPSCPSETIRFADFGIPPLQSRTTYNITLRFDQTNGKIGGQNESQISFDECLSLAQNGSSAGWRDLGKCYLYGIGTAENPSEAMRCFEKAAKYGDLEAIFLIGNSYYYGLGSPKNYDIAVDYWRKSAKKNHAPSLYFLGLCYEYGHGVKKDVKKSMEYFEKSASLGFSKAKDKLNDGNRERQ